MNSRTILMLQEENLKFYQDKKIAIFGVGGVGGYVLEGLVRSGFKYIDIYDFDQVDVSNLNRQIIATNDTIGQVKVVVAKKRAQSINDEVLINDFNFFVDESNIEQIEFSKYDYVVDAIDTVSSKLLIIQKCKEFSVPVISSMGTGNKLDPSKLLITDINKTSICPLAKIVRKKCRDLGIKHLTVLTSLEEPIKTHTRNPGSMVFVPASAGLMIASYILRHFLGEKNA